MHALAVHIDVHYSKIDDEAPCKLVSCRHGEIYEIDLFSVNSVHAHVQIHDHSESVSKCTTVLAKLNRS